MTRILASSLLVASSLAVTDAFTGPSVAGARTQHASAAASTVARNMAVDEDMDRASPRFLERGVSVDQDGKSNVWAIEPKMEVSSKSSEENLQSALVAGGGLAVLAVLAGVALLNLPDPNQF